MLENRVRRVAVRLCFVALACAVLAYSLHALVDLGGSGTDDFFGKWLYDGIVLVSAGLCVWRAVSVREDRAAWLLLAAGMLSWAAGNVYYILFIVDLEVQPIPSVADALWLGIYPPALAMLVLLIRSRSPRFQWVLWLDGLIAALAVASVSAAFVLQVIIDAPHDGLVQTITNFAYPVGDLLLLALVLEAGALNGWRFERSWAYLAAGFASFAVTDGVFLYQIAHGTYVPSGIVDVGWLIAAVLFAYAAWQRPDRRRGLDALSWRLLAVPAVFAVVALAVLVYGYVERLSPLVLMLAAGAVAAVIARMVLTFRQNLQMLSASREEALTDALTGLANRRQLMLDLEARLATDDERASFVLVLFDLDGFKPYNDTFGHPAGDELLTRLGRQLSASTVPYGTAYRMGGDEFCVLADTADEHPEPLITQWALALSDEGEGFSVTSSHGWCSLPGEAATPSAALLLADQRMYRNKQRGRPSPGEQSKDVLVATIRQRSRDLDGHGQGVAGLAEAVAVRLGLPDEHVDDICQAARLHDVGKVAIPDAILDKPGPLDDDEWRFIRRHTLIGESIIVAAPALTPVARLVRSTHERYDGGGYPDGLSGNEIPLGARIIAVCDAFDAMVSERPYASRLSAGEALAELARGSGTQFDPGVVDAFMAQATIVPVPLPGSPTGD